MFTFLSTTLRLHGPKMPALSQSCYECNRMLSRHFAFGAKWKNAPKKKKRQQHLSKAAKKARHDRRCCPVKRNAPMVPPALLVPTASPHVYVSMVAMQKSSNLHLDPQSAYTDIVDVESIRPICRYFGTISPTATNDGSSLPEVAFLGRSNVGKSSLVNALTSSSLARVSKQPGRTQHPHFLECTKRLAPSSSSSKASSSVIGYLMDLPGYGYAVGPDVAVDAWQRRTQQVLMHRRDVGALKRIYLLADGRHGATSLDFSIMSWLEEGEFPFSVVFTKSDAVSLPMIVKHVNLVCMRYHHQTLNANAEPSSSMESSPKDILMSPFVYVSSSKNGTGMLELWKSILREFKLKII